MGEENKSRKRNQPQKQWGFAAYICIYFRIPTPAEKAFDKGVHGWNRGWLKLRGGSGIISASADHPYGDQPPGAPDDTIFETHDITAPVSLNDKEVMGRAYIIKQCLVALDHVVLFFVFCPSAQTLEKQGQRLNSTGGQGTARHHFEIDASQTHGGPNVTRPEECNARKNG